VLDQDKQYFKLDIQPLWPRPLRADRLQFWTYTLPQKINSLQGLK
jgi:hypothetical protein